jgi:hypothetical protein
MSAPTASRYSVAEDYAGAAQERFRFMRAVNGFDPAEVLGPSDRRLLMRLLVTEWRWSDAQISRHTKWTPYTVARIREGRPLFLQPCSGENVTVTPPDWTP